VHTHTHVHARTHMRTHLHSELLKLMLTNQQILHAMLLLFTLYVHLYNHTGLVCGSIFAHTLLCLNYYAYN